MPIENPKEILDFLDAGDVESLDDFKQKFSEKFVKRDYQAIKDDKELYGKVTGAYNESNKVAFKRVAKEHGVDLSAADLDKMNIGEIISNVLPSALKNFSTEIASLKESSGKGVNEKVQAVQSEFEKYKAEVTPKVAEYDKVVNDFKTFKESAQKEKSDFIRTHKEEGIWGGYNWSQKAGPLAKNGFRAAVESKYQRTLDESGDIIVTDKQGNRIPDPSKAGAYKSYAQILVDEGIEANKTDSIYAVTDNKQQQQEVRRTFSFKAAEDKDQPQGRKINTGTRVKTSA